MKPDILLLRALRHPDQLAACTLADWDILLRQAAAANLLARLYYLVEQHGLVERVPASALVHLGWARVAAERHAQAVRWEVRQVRQALAALDAPLILLKGAAYAMAKLPPAAGRLFSDIDILVPPDRLAQAEGALLLHGWVATHLDEYDQRYYRQWMHELPPMMHVKRQTAIDVHHAILPLTAPVHPDPAQLRAAATGIPGESGLQTLAPADLVLHSATHLFFDGELEHGMRDLADIDGLLRHFGTDIAFWQALTLRARRLELARPLFYALRYSSLLLHTPVPDEAMAAAAQGGGRPPAPLLALMDQLFGRALLPAHSSCSDALTPAARLLLYIRANWLRMPPLMLARHLFHKAFLSPRHEKSEQNI
ncbi:MAG: nucleotidyltransferase family protein [Pseudomonadota bacterium]